MPCDASVFCNAAMVIKTASSVRTTRLPCLGQVLIQWSNMSLASSASHFRSSSASTAVSIPVAPPKTMTACENRGMAEVTSDEIGVPLSDVPMVRSYPFYACSRSALIRRRDKAFVSTRYSQECKVLTCCSRTRRGSSTHRKWALCKDFGD
jgi:hypothetical protein